MFLVKYLAQKPITLTLAMARKQNFWFGVQLSYHKATVSLTSKTLSLSVALHDLMTSFILLLASFLFFVSKWCRETAWHMWKRNPYYYFVDTECISRRYRKMNLVLKGSFNFFFRLFENSGQNFNKLWMSEEWYQIKVKTPQFYSDEMK